MPEGKLLVLVLAVAVLARAEAMPESPSPFGSVGATGADVDLHQLGAEARAVVAADELVGGVDAAILVVVVGVIDQGKVAEAVRVVASTSSSVALVGAVVAVSPSPEPPTALPKKNTSPTATAVPTPGPSGSTV